MFMIVDGVLKAQMQQHARRYLPMLRAIVEDSPQLWRAQVSAALVPDLVFPVLQATPLEVAVRLRRFSMINALIEANARLGWRDALAVAQYWDPEMMQAFAGATETTLNLAQSRLLAYALVHHRHDLACMIFTREADGVGGAAVSPQAIERITGLAMLCSRGAGFARTSSFCGYGVEVWHSMSDAEMLEFLVPRAVPATWCASDAYEIASLESPTTAFLETVC